MKLNVFSDGGARGNPGPGAVGVVVYDANYRKLAEHGDCIGNTTNNIAEYLALIAAQELAQKLGGDEIDFHLDSELVVKQMRGEYKIKNENLKQLWQVVKSGERLFRKVTYTHLRREHPHMQEADRMVNQALDA